MTNDGSPRTTRNEANESRQPNYNLRRAGAATLLVLTGLGAWKAGELAVEAKDWLSESDRVVGCATVDVNAGESAISVVNRGIDKVGEQPKWARETMQTAENLGMIHPGQEIKVCVINDNVLGKYATAEHVDK